MAPKLSKKEKQALKEAEEARLAEEKRIQEEKEEKERQEELAKRAKEEKERQAEEAAMMGNLDYTLDEEAKANGPWDSQRALELMAEASAALSGAEWTAFLACHELPSARSEADVNTFLTEWREKLQEDIWKTLLDCTSAADLLGSLQLESA